MDGGKNEGQKVAKKERESKEGREVERV